MPDPVVTAPAEVVPAVAPASADNQPVSEVVPESVKKLVANLFAEPEFANAPPKRDKPEDDEPVKPVAEATPTKPKGETAAKPSDKVPPAPDIRLRKPKAPTRPELPIATPVAPVAPVREEPYKDDPQWEATLEENEREMIADAKFAEQRFPEKYKGLAARTAKFLRDHAALTAKEDFDDQSTAYRQWLEKNQPKLGRQEIREIEAARVTDTVKKEYDGKLSDVQHKLFVREHEPKIEAEAKQTFNELSNVALPDEVMAAIKKDGFEKANEQFGLEIETTQAVLTAATDDITEFKRITTRDPETGRPLQAPIEDPSHPKYAQHQRLSQMVGDIGEAFKNNAPPEKQLRDGKWFVTRDEWNQLQPAQRGRFWTFTNAELITEAKRSMKQIVANAIETKRGYMQKLGFTRVTKTAEPPKPIVKAEPPVPTNTPRIASATPVPGSSDGVPTEIEQRAARMAKALGRDNLS